MTIEDRGFIPLAVELNVEKFNEAVRSLGIEREIGLELDFYRSDCIAYFDRKEWKVKLNPFFLSEASMRLDDTELQVFIGQVVAHEVRHAWQLTHHPRRAKMSTIFAAIGRLLSRVTTPGFLPAFLLGLAVGILTSGLLLFVVLILILNLRPFFPVFCKWAGGKIYSQAWIERDAVAYEQEHFNEWLDCVAIRSLLPH